MPRGPRLDYPGAIHHVIVRGIERRRIFRRDRDRDHFLERLATLVRDTQAALYAWALMPNHAHVLLRTGALPLSRLAQRWLGPYATTFNRVHQRAGHLFQNRFKNTLVEEEPYLLELLRYIHLNPVRSTLPVTLDSLDRYPWTGHAVLLGHRAFPAQDTDFILRQFGTTVDSARQVYRQFVSAAADTPRRCDLEGGGLRRSAGGWQVVQALARGRERWAHDERILGSTDFVQRVLREHADLPARPTINPCATLDALCARAAAHFGLERGEIAGASVRHDVLAARAVISHLAVRHHGMSLTAVGRHLSLSKQSIARALGRAASVYRKRGCTAADFLLDR